METAYLLFTEEDPIKKLEKMAEHLPMHKKVALAPHIRRADTFVQKARGFRAILIDDEYALVSELFKIYFENSITKGKLTIIPNSTCGEFFNFFKKVTAPMRLSKIQERAYHTLIRKVGSGMDDFVSAYVYIKTAEEQYRRFR